MRPIRFAMNRTCAPRMPLDAFIALAAGAGVEAVEVRNDIEGREFANGMAAPELRDMLGAAWLKLASINALQRFNDWSREREQEARSLIAYAAALGAPGLVLCPVHVPGHGWSPAEHEAQLRQSLRMLRPILEDHGVTGYVEPLGMTYSTMKRQQTAVAAVTDIDGWGAFKLCHDTFQFYRCSDDRMFPEHIGLVHVSGISRPDLAPSELSEPDRGFVFAGDRVGNIHQLKQLRAAGYAGYVSMEPFDPAAQQDPAIAERIGESFAHVAAAIATDGAA